MHPYEMYQLLLERRDGHVMKVRAGSLYHAIERLDRDGLVTAVGTDRAGNRPERTTYALTDAGRSALHASVTEMLRTPVNEFPRFAVALNEAHNLSLEEAVVLFEQRRTALDAEISELTTIIESARGRAVDEAYWFVADYRRTVLAAERDWLDRIIDRLRTKDLTWPHPA
ncbi:PadR family transcriptional regulator [Mumia zhuanghuii]|nr:PadR family transcriptional regulator [Mumia zhuanghuii]